MSTDTLETVPPLDLDFSLADDPSTATHTPHPPSGKPVASPRGSAGRSKAAKKVSYRDSVETTLVYNAEDALNRRKVKDGNDASNKAKKDKKKKHKR